jgi:DNA-binding MarR family transcriptional regulator
MMITSGTMTNRIDRLEQRGLVERVKSPADGRIVLVTLTAVGLHKVDAALVDHAANDRRIIEVLTPAQRGQLVDLLRVLHHAVEDAPS